VAKLIYEAISSLDGYIEDAAGKFEWAEPDEEVHRFVNDLDRPVGTYLYGRRMYETMVFWEHPPELAEQPPFVQGLRGDLAGSGQDRLLEDATDAIERQDPDRARVRP
jgi:dihydrofolate reductase